MNIYEFMSDSPFLTFFIIVGIGIVIETIFSGVIEIIKNKRGQND